jgi:hypothetical protein
MAVKKPKKRGVKKKKLDPFPKIYRRLAKLWRAKVFELHGGKCAISGTASGTIIDGKPAILDAHHLEHENACRALRFDALNGILLTKLYHKYGKNSAHRGPVWFSDWLIKNRRAQRDYVLAHRTDTIDLKDREVLAGIEERLKAPPTDEERAIITTSENFE